MQHDLQSGTTPVAGILRDDPLLVRAPGIAPEMCESLLDRELVHMLAIQHRPSALLKELRAPRPEVARALVRLFRSGFIRPIDRLVSPIPVLETESVEVDDGAIQGWRATSPEESSGRSLSSTLETALQDVLGQGRSAIHRSIAQRAVDEASLDGLSSTLQSALLDIFGESSERAPVTQEAYDVEIIAPGPAERGPRELRAVRRSPRSDGASPVREKKRGRSASA